MNELIKSLLVHIEEVYPKGGFLYVPPHLTPAEKPFEKIAPPIAKPSPKKSLPGVTLHSVPPTPVLIVHGGEKGEALALLERLKGAFSKKRIVSQVAIASSITPSLLKSPLVKLIALTPEASQALGPFDTHAKTYVMEAPHRLMTHPHLRQPLWSALCALL